MRALLVLIMLIHRAVSSIIVCSCRTRSFPWELCPFTVALDHRFWWVSVRSPPLPSLPGPLPSLVASLVPLFPAWCRWSFRLLRDPSSPCPSSLPSASAYACSSGLLPICWLCLCLCISRCPPCISRCHASAGSISPPEIIAEFTFGVDTGIV